MLRTGHIHAGDLGTQAAGDVYAGAPTEITLNSNAAQNAFGFESGDLAYHVSHEYGHTIQFATGDGALAPLLRTGNMATSGLMTIWMKVRGWATGDRDAAYRADYAEGAAIRFGCRATTNHGPDAKGWCGQ
jgi:hypothetical protein